MRALVLLLIAAIAAPLSAQSIALPNLADGTYLLRVQGQSVTIEVPRVPGGVVPGPGPVVPTPDPVSDLSARLIAEINKTPASDARHAGAMKLAKIYEMLAGQAIPPGNVSAIATISKLALGSDAAAWSGVCAIVESSLANCSSESACDAVLMQAAQAIGSTVPASGTDQQAAEKYGFDWDSFLKFLMQLLVVLLPLLI